MKKAVIILLVLITALGCLPLSVSAGEYGEFGKIVTIKTNANNIVIDGKIDSGEWGDPLIVETPQSLTDKSDMGWGYVKAKNTPPNQRVEIYLANEGGVLYVACKLIDADYEEGAPALKNLISHAHFGFSMATYDEKTVVQRGIYANQTYEYFGYYAFGIVEGKKQCLSRTQGSAVRPLVNSDFAVNYDAATRTYIYEVRVKEGLSRADLLKHNKVVMSFNISGPLIDNSRNLYMISEAGYRILSGKGSAGQFTHAKSKPVLVNILETADMVTNEFVPTDDEAALAVGYQSGFVPVDKIRTPGEGKSWLEIAVPIAAIAARSILIFTVIFALVKRKRQ